MTRGHRIGADFPLEPTGENRIGRGAECEVVLTDPLCSRVHAIVRHDERQSHWLVRDAGSRNGSFVNEQRIDEAQLVEGTRLRLGGTEFVFHWSKVAPHDDSRRLHLTQTILHDDVFDPNETGAFALSALHDPRRAHDFLLLHQLSLRLLECPDPEVVIRTALEVAHGRTQAAAVGFLWVTDDGRFKTKLVIPEAAAPVATLSESLTRKVYSERRAVWVASQAAPHQTDSLNHYADAICVPLLDQQRTIGALHLYLQDGRFQKVDMEFSLSLATILSKALIRARQQATLAAEHRRLVDKSATFDELIGDSQPMRDLKQRIARVARASGCVLIRGESGAGKELVARALHKASPRADRPLLSVNCAAIPAELMESQLFGHKKGSFTGADADHAGYFQQADLGTLFLDEVGELTLDGQAKLLRILEGHPFLPVGAVREVSVDVRVIAATNRDLGEFVRERRFREDLYYRLSVFELPIPPLRERADDVARLVEHFLDHFRREHGRPQLQLTDAARRKLLDYAWPGNVRQLRNVIDSAVVMADADEIQPTDLGLRDARAAELDSLRLDVWERRLIEAALERAAGNVNEAARLLGIGRATLYRKLDEFGLKEK